MKNEPIKFSEVSKAFYNTIRLNREDYKDATGKAARQEDLVLKFFMKNPENEYTPFEVRHFCFEPRVPVTSIRRAISNLTSLGYLEKTKNQREGEHGMPNHTWKLVTEQKEQKELFFK